MASLAQHFGTLQEMKDAIMADDTARFLAALDLAAQYGISPEQVKDTHDWTIRSTDAPFDKVRHDATRAYPNHVTTD